MPDEKKPELCNAVITADRDGSAPIVISATSYAEFVVALYKALMDAKKGHVNVFLNSKPAKLSLPKQIFVLKLADGETPSELRLEPAATWTFSESGQFEILE